MQNTTQTRRLTILGIVLLLAAAGAASGPAKSSPTAWGYDFHAVVPLGYDTLRLEPAKKVVCLLASAEAIGFEGLQRREDNGRVLVTSANGEPVKHYPEVIDFRVTASARKKKLADSDDAPYPVHAEQPGRAAFVPVRQPDRLGDRQLTLGADRDQRLAERCDPRELVPEDSLLGLAHAHVDPRAPEHVRSRLHLPPREHLGRERDHGRHGGLDDLDSPRAVRLEVRDRPGRDTLRPGRGARRSERS